MIKRANMNWSAKQIAKMIRKFTITFDNVVQRCLVWGKKRKSLFIHSLIAGYPIPPFYAARTEKGYDMLDGKQRANTIADFLDDMFELVDIPDVEVETENGTEVINFSGMKFSELPESVKETICDYSLTVYYFEDITEDEIAEMFYRLNNGKPLSAFELSRVRAKSLADIREVGSHELFKNAMTQKALEKYTNEDIVVKSYILLHEKEPSLENKVVKPMLESMELTDADKKQLNEVYDRIFAIHEMIEDKKIKKRLLTRTHLVSIIPTIWRSIEDGRSDREVMEWFCSFFDGKTKATNSSTYNNFSGSGSGSKTAVVHRLDELRRSYDKHFKLGAWAPQKTA